MSRVPSYLRLLGRDYVSLGLSVLSVVALAVAVGMTAHPSASSLDGVDGVGPAVMLALAVPCAGWAAVRVVRIRRLLTTGIEVQGQVLVVAANSDDVWYAILGYHLDGVDHRVKAVNGTPPPYQPGDRLTLRVALRRPSRAVVQGQYM